jgi:hypothetical protein
MHPFKTKPHRYSDVTSFGGSGREIISYEVVGLPPKQKAWVVRQDGEWELIREYAEGHSEWLGQYTNVDAALRALASKLSG